MQTDKIRLILGLLVFVLLSSGCMPAAFVPTMTPAADGVQLFPSNEFYEKMEGEDGILIEFRGFSRGFYPGDEAAYQFEAHNLGSTAWSPRYCLLLLSEEGIAANLEAGEFTLQPGEGFGSQIIVEFPEDLLPGSYGLAFTIPDRTSLVTTIQIGAGEFETPPGFWPEPVCP
jgi:hypothetical protein